LGVSEIVLLWVGDRRPEPEARGQSNDTPLTRDRKALLVKKETLGDLSALEALEWGEWERDARR